MASPQPSRYRALFWLTFILLESVFIAISILSYSKQNITALFFLYLFSFLPFILAFQAGPRSKFSVRTLFLTGLIFRVTLLASDPIYSDDIFRYLWEGKVQQAGINPYVSAPSAPVTEPFRDAYYALVNHKEIPTIYPPLSQLFFRICTALVYNLYFLKAVLVVLDMGVLLFLYALVRVHHLPLHYLLIYAWHPLVIVEIAGSGHQDIIGIFFLTGCLFFVQHRKIWGAAAMLIGSVLSKLFPIVLFPLLLRRQTKRPYLLLAAISVLMYLPFWSADGSVFSGLKTYTESWEANASVFYLMKLATQNPLVAKSILLAVFLGIFLYTYRYVADFETGAMIMLGSYLILSPTLHPWYILWMIPFLALRPNAAWIWLTLAVAGYYHILIDFYGKGIWKESLGIKGLIYIPFLVLVGISHIKKRKAQHA